ncbi:trigger factor [Fagus crenata]
MEIALNTLFLGFNPKIIASHKQPVHGFTSRSSRFSPHFRYHAPYFAHCTIPLSICVISQEYHPAVCAVISGAEDVGVSSSQFDDFSVAATSTSKARELKISVEVFGAKNQAIFDNVFDKMVAAAQPILGFRRAKGGELRARLRVVSLFQSMSNTQAMGLIFLFVSIIPKDILLEILGPSKVYEGVIKEVINSTIAEYVEKEGLKISKDLRVEQSFEDLEATFEAGQKFSFDVVLQL